MDSHKWLDAQFLAKVLEAEQPQSLGITITTLEVNPAVPAGNNYGSQILRVTVNYVSAENPNLKKTVSLIIKAPIKNEVTAFIEGIIEMAEYNFYYSYYPKVREITNIKIAPKTYSSDVKGLIVMEDLKEAGFYMANRHDQLDFEHCKLYIETVAKFHAAGMAIARKNPDLPASFPNCMEKMIKDNDERGKMLMQNQFVAFQCFVKSIEAMNINEYQPYLDVIKKFSTAPEEFWQIYMFRGMQKRQDQLKSFIHGDCWTTNMLFKCDDEKPTDIRLIDFQLFAYDSIVSDVMNFTWLSARNEVLEPKPLKELQCIYCDTLNVSLAEQGITDVKISYERLKKEILERSFQALFVITVMLPLTLGHESIDGTGLFSASTSEDKLKSFYRGEQFLKKFPYLIKLAAQQGVFSILEEEYAECEKMLKVQKGEGTCLFKM